MWVSCPPFPLARRGTWTDFGPCCSLAIRWRSNVAFVARPRGDQRGRPEAVRVRFFLQHNEDSDGVIDLPQFPVLGDSDGEDMPALVGDSDGEDMPELFFSESDEEDIHAPPGPAAAALGFANPGHQD
jgi:hypothetical protein